MEAQKTIESKKVEISWAIPVRSLHSLLMLLIILPFTVINFMYVFIPGFMEIKNHEEKFMIEDLGYIWIPILVYTLSVLSLLLIVRIFIPLITKVIIRGIILGVIIGIVIYFGLEILTPIGDNLLEYAIGFAVFWTVYYGAGGKLISDTTT